MNLLSVLNTFFVCIQCERDLITVRKVFLLENDFWRPDQDQVKINNKNLAFVNISVEGETSCPVGIDYFKRGCYLDKYSNLYYALLENWMAEDLKLSSDAPLEKDEGILQFKYIYTAELVKDGYGYETRRNKETDVYHNYKIIEKNPDNVVTLKSDGKEIHMHHIKNIFVALNSINMLKLEDYIATMSVNMTKVVANHVENIKDYDEKVDFNLQYFKNYLDCLDNLRPFVNSFSYLTMSDDGFTFVLVKGNGNSDNVTTTSLETIIRNKLIAEYNNNKMNIDSAKPVKPIKLEWLLSLSSKLCNHLKEVLVAKQIFLPIGGKYDVNYYLDQINRCIFEEIESYVSDFKSYGDEINKRISILSLIESFEMNLSELSEKAMNDLCEGYIHEHFPKLIGRDIEALHDFVLVEKIVCDYYNMSVLISNSARNIHGPCRYYKYRKPIYIDDYNYRIIEGIKIKFEYPKRLKELIGYTYDLKEITPTKDSDYFIDIYDDDQVYILAKTISSKKIHKIKAISLESDLEKEIVVSEFLRI